MDELDVFSRIARWLAALPGELGAALLSLLGILVALTALVRASRPVPLNSAFARRPEPDERREPPEIPAPRRKPLSVP